MVFLNLINISEKSLVLAVITGVTTYFQMNVSLGKASEASSQGDMAKMMNTQMKYFLPVLMAFIAYKISVAVALYLISSNLFAIAQEIYIKKKYHKSILVV